MEGAYWSQWLQDPALAERTDLSKNQKKMYEADGKTPLYTKSRDIHFADTDENYVRLTELVTHCIVCTQFLGNLMDVAKHRGEDVRCHVPEDRKHSIPPRMLVPVLSLIHI